MQTLKNIFAIVSSLVILMGANGFILEEYFCSGCNKEKHVVEFFEFGELDHDHAHCTSCTEEHKTCSCHDNNHIKNTKISFINLDVLFLNFDKAEVSKTIITELNKKTQNTLIDGYKSVFQFKFDKTLLKIPPLLIKFPHHTDLCVVFSVFRL